MESVPGLENGCGQCSRCHTPPPKAPIHQAGPALALGQPGPGQRGAWMDNHPAAGVRGERLGVGSQGER